MANMKEVPLTTPLKQREDYVVHEMTDVCGSYGPWQRTVFILTLMSCFPAAWHNLGITFFAYPADHWCSKPDHLANMTNEKWKELAIPKISIKGHEKYDECRMYNLQNFSDSIEWLNVRKDTVPCHSWDFDRSVFASTIVNTWNLVCEDSWMVSLSQSIYMVGFLTATSVGGQMGDKFGRRPVIIFCTVALQCGALAIAFSTSFIFFLFMRFFIALGAAGLFTTYFVTLMEMVGPKTRPIAGALLGLGWALGLVTLTAWAWLLKDWFNLQLALTFPGFLLLIAWWVMPESPRWLLSQGRLEEARAILEKAADQNGKSCAQIYMQSNAFFRGIEKSRKLQVDEKPKKANVLDLLRTPNIRKKTLVLFFCWFVVSFIYYGLSLNTSDLGGDPFVNFAISAAVEFPSMFAAYYIIVHLGRRKPMAAMFVLGGLACLLTIPVSDDMVWLRVTLAMAGKLCISAAFGTIYIYSAELYPTVVRNVGVGASSTCARFGSIIAPFVKELGKATSIGVPLGIFGAMSAVSGMLSLLLPETHNHPIQDSIQQAEDFGRKAKKGENMVDELEQGNINLALDVNEKENL